jgi:O-antigen/teichoic acid export membrane protein
LETSEVFYMKNNVCNDTTIRTGIFVTLGRVLGILLLLGNNALIARLLSPADVGIYFVLSSLSAVVATIAMMGQQLATVRFIANALACNDKIGAAEIVRSALVITGCTSIVVLSLITIIWSHLDERLVQTIGASGGIACGVWIALLALQTVAGESFRGYGRIGWASIFTGIATSAVNLIALALLRWTGNTQFAWILWTSVGAQAVGACIAVTLILFSIGPRGGFSKVPLFRFGVPLMFFATCTILISQLDLWYVATYFSSREAGLYGSAMRMVLIIILPLSLINSVIMPKIAHFHSIGDFKGLERMLRVSATLTGIPSIMGLILLIIFGGNTLRFIFGDAYEPAKNVLLVLSIGQIINVLLGSSGITLLMTGHQYLVSITSIITLFLFIAFLLVIHPNKILIVATAAIVIRRSKVAR